MNTTEHWEEKTALTRHEMIAPLLDDTLDVQKKLLLRKQQAEKYGVSIRSLYRYETAYRQGGFSALKPQSRHPKPSKLLPPNYEQLVQEAIQLKREIPSRSVNQIIMILEMEGRVESGVLVRSTLQRHLFAEGYGRKHLQRYTEGKVTACRRFQKPHRMMLLQGDIKYGLKLPIGKNNAMVQTYLSAFIDDCSRFVVASGFYATQDGIIVEDTLKRAILQHGKPESIYVDNGKQYVSRWMTSACAKLGIRHYRCQPFTPRSKGKIEKFNGFVNHFLAEAKVAKIKTLEELNHRWDVWLEAYYHEKPHEGLGDNITPRMAWGRDSKLLNFMDVSVVAEAFLHHEKRLIDKSGCLNFQGRKYDVSLSMIDHTVEISYDPMATETLRVTCDGFEPIEVHPLSIPEYCGKTPKLPDRLATQEPISSRFLDGLEERRETQRNQTMSAISFHSYRKEASK